MPTRREVAPPALPAVATAGPVGGTTTELMASGSLSGTKVGEAMKINGTSTGSKADKPQTSATGRLR